MKYQTKSTNPKDLLGVKRVPLHLVPGTAMAHVAMAHLDGALKYGQYNWREEGVSVSVYMSAALRHIEDYLNGELLAEDSQVLHLAHAIATLNIVIDAMEIGNLIDDRPTPGPVAELMERLKSHPLFDRLDDDDEPEPAPPVQISEATDAELIDELDQRGVFYRGA